MSYNIIATPKFKRELKRLVKRFLSLKNEYAILIDELTENPTTGILIGNNCYKRYALLLLLRVKAKAGEG